MSGNFNMKEWMHQNGQGPYKLHENYIDLKALGLLKEKDEEEIEADQEEEKPGRPPHATSIEPWWEKKIKDEEERMSNKYTKNLDDEESGASLKEEEDEDIPYAEEIPDEEDGVYEMGKKLYDQTQEILNTKGAKVVNSLTLLQVASNVEKYKALLGQLKSFKGELSNGLDIINDYVEEAGYDSKDPKVKELDKIRRGLDDDLEVLGDIAEILDSMVFLVRNGWKEKGLTLGKTDVASNDKSLPLGEI